MLNLVNILVLLSDSSLLLLDLLLSSLHLVSQCQLVQRSESKKSLKVVTNEKQRGFGNVANDRNWYRRMNYKDTKPYMSAFLSVDLLTDCAAFCLTDFIDWRYIHSWLVFSTQLVNCCPHGWRNYMVLLYCCPSTVPSLWPPPRSPHFPMYSLYRQCVTVGGGGVEMYCGPYSARVLHSVSDQFQNLQNCFTTPNKNDQ
jgi:hypothetical protein